MTRNLEIQIDDLYIVRRGHQLIVPSLFPVIFLIFKYILHIDLLYVKI